VSRIPKLKEEVLKGIQEKELINWMEIRRIEEIFAGMTEARRENIFSSKR
jgi:uncharacterized protein (DUF169 family)